MHRTKLSIAVALALAVSLAAYAAEQQPSPAEAIYRRAFEADLELAKRVELLERVVKEHPENRWADDALWALGESARQRGRPRLVVYYWQYLLVSRTEVKLEQFTLGKPIYKGSRVHQVHLYARMTGAAYSRDQKVRTEQAGEQRVYVNAEPFDPVPVAVWEGLGHAYRRLGKPNMAARAYRMARVAAPERGRWAQNYRKRVRYLEVVLTRDGPPEQGAAPGQPDRAPAAASAPQPAGASPG